MTIDESTLARPRDESRALMQVALGQDKADLAVVNARVANVYTGELIDQCAISAKGRWIAYVGRNPDDTIGPKILEWYYKNYFTTGKISWTYQC